MSRFHCGCHDLHLWLLSCLFLLVPCPRWWRQAKLNSFHLQSIVTPSNIGRVNRRRNSLTMIWIPWKEILEDDLPSEFWGFCWWDSEWCDWFLSSFSQELFALFHFLPRLKPKTIPRFCARGMRDSEWSCWQLRDDANKAGNLKMTMLFKSTKRYK